MFILINEMMFNVIASLSLQCSDPQVYLVTGEVIPNPARATVGCSLGAFLTGCWLKVPLQRAFLSIASNPASKELSLGEHMQMKEKLSHGFDCVKISVILSFCGKNLGESQALAFGVVFTDVRLLELADKVCCAKVCTKCAFVVWVCTQQLCLSF